MSLRALVYNITRIQRGSWLKQQNPAFVLGHGTMFHAPRHHNKFAFFNPFLPVEELHAESAFHHEEHFIFIVVMMKNKLALGLHQLYHLSVELARDVRLVVFRNLGKLFSDVDFSHEFNLPAVYPLQIHPAEDWSQKSFTWDTSCRV